MNTGDQGTILIVDDDASIRRLTAMMLKRNGYSVIEAECGPEGLERFTQHRNEVRLILSDVVMPMMLGTEMIRQIHAVDPLVPVLFMTGYISEAKLPQSVPVLMKPFTASDLMRTVSVAISGKPALESRPN